MTSVKHHLITNPFPILQHLHPLKLCSDSFSQSITRRCQLRHPQSIPFCLKPFPVLPSLPRPPAHAPSCLLQQGGTLNHILIRRFSCGHNPEKRREHWSHHFHFICCTHVIWRSNRQDYHSLRKSYILLHMKQQGNE